VDTIKIRHSDNSFIRIFSKHFKSKTFTQRIMGNEKSKATGHSIAAKQAEQASAHLKGAIPRGRINVQMVQNVLLIWLDGNINDNNDDCRNTVSQLRRAVHDINKFTDGDQCIQFLETVEQEKACMIISGSLGQQIVPRVHGMSQVDSIFIFCGNKKHHEQWAKEWPKIKGFSQTLSQSVKP
jgi:hypothetical protein